MKTKSTIKLFATALLATTAIGAADIVNTTNNVFASEVTQVPNKNNVGTRTTFETDPVFNNFEEGEKYLDNYVKPTIENSRYGYYTASVVPDGLGGKYLVEGFIDSHSEDEEVIKGNKETAQKIVDNAGKDLKPVTPEKPVTPVTPEPEKPSENPVKPTEDSKQENPVKPTEDTKSETSVKPSEEKSDSTKSVKETKELPNTGTADSSSASIGLMILSVLAGFFGFKKRNI